MVQRRRLFLYSSFILIHALAVVSFLKSIFFPFLRASFLPPAEEEVGVTLAPVWLHVLADFQLCLCLKISNQFNEFGFPAWNAHHFHFKDNGRIGRDAGFARRCGASFAAKG